MAWIKYARQAYAADMGGTGGAEGEAADTVGGAAEGATGGEQPAADGTGKIPGRPERAAFRAAESSLPGSGDEKGAGSTETVFAAFNERLKAATEAAVAEAAKKAGMTPEEKTAYEHAQKLAEIERREKEIALRELRADTAQTLAAKGLPAEVLDIVMGADKAATEKNIAAFTKAYNAAVSAQVDKRLGGKTPPAGAAAPAGSAARDQFRKAIGGY